MAWQDDVGFGVDQFGELWGYTHPTDRITPIGGGVVVGSTYYPPIVASGSVSTLAVVAIAGLAALWLMNDGKRR